MNVTPRRADDPLYRQCPACQTWFWAMTGESICPKHRISEHWGSGNMLVCWFVHRRTVLPAKLVDESDLLDRHFEGEINSWEESRRFAYVAERHARLHRAITEQGAAA